MTNFIQKVAKMPEYTVRVKRVYEEEWIDFDITADTEEEAEARALEEAEENDQWLWGPTPEPELVVDEVEELED